MIKPSRSVHDVAEISGRRRFRFFAAQAALFCLWQATWVSSYLDGPSTRTVDRFGGISWLAWAVVLLVLLARGGFLATPRAVLDYMNDELSRANRSSAFTWAFWGTVGLAIAFYAIALFDVVPVRLALHCIVSVGVAVALGRFAYLERRAYRGQ